MKKRKQYLLVLLMLKSSIDVGRQYEQKAISILRENGFKDIEWISEKNNNSPFDLKAQKDGRTYLIEARFRSFKSNSPFFCFAKKKLTILRSMKYPVILLLMNEIHYEFLYLRDVKENTFPVSIKNKKLYVIGNTLKRIIKDNKEIVESNLYVRNLNGSRGLFLTRFFNMMGLDAGDKVSAKLEDGKLIIEKVEKK